MHTRRDGDSHTAVLRTKYSGPRRLAGSAREPRSGRVPTGSRSWRSTPPLRSGPRSRLLPKTRVSVDHFQLVKLAHDTVTTVRRRVSRGRGGRQIDLAWANRLVLLRGYDKLSTRGLGRLDEVLAADDPTLEIGAALGRQGAAPA